ncbi:MAG: hypothetical protein HY720_27165, partial [Planctomycetes bacterium]|nr:hypothetical protein [Planctomycetota bacterium]
MSRRGFVEYEGAWVTHEERSRLEEKARANAMIAQGKVLVDGNWIPRAEYEAIRAREEFEKLGYVQIDDRWVSPEEAALLRGEPPPAPEPSPQPPP